MTSLHLDLRSSEPLHCPFCREEFGEQREPRRCGTCDTAVHPECWTEHAGCTTAGCAEGPPPRPVGAIRVLRERAAPAEPAESEERAPSDWDDASTLLLLKIVFMPPGILLLIYLLKLLGTG